MTLVPHFSDGEPNLISTRKKNENGKCCFHFCDNQLPKEKYHYMGFLACEECGKKVRASMQEVQDASLAEFIERIISLCNKEK